MQIEVITIGSELLCGRVLDTNFVYLAKKFSEEGYEVFRHTSIGDDPVMMKQVFEEAFQRSDIILTTGGLGPTLDDKTKEVLAALFQRKLILCEEIKNDLIQRYGSKLLSLEHQATVPEDTEILKNKVGTAPGFLFKRGQKSFFVMPGVPTEMKTMFEEEVFSKIKTLLSKEETFFSRSIHLCHLPENSVDPCLRELEKLYPAVEKGIYPGYGILSVEFKLKAKSEALASNILEKCVKRITDNFGQYVFSTQDHNLSLAIQKKMIAHRKTLVLAESCTGGHIAAKLVNIPSASEYFLGGVVCYNNLLKKRWLGVKEETLSKYGAVSYETTFEMLQGALDLSGADYALAVTGVAGPSGGSQEKPVGTVWCGLGMKGEKPYIGKIAAKGRAKRELVIEYASNFVLGVLWRQIAYGINSLL